MLDTMDYQELGRLKDEITRQLWEDLTTANRMGYLDQFLGSINFDYSNYASKKEAITKNILIIGECRNHIKDINGMVAQIGLDPELFKFEYVLSYSDCEKFNFEKIEPPTRYNLILLGPMPHKLKGTKNSSIINTIESYADEYDDYPHVERLMNGLGELHISLNNLARALGKFYDRITVTEH